MGAQLHSVNKVTPACPRTLGTKDRLETLPNLLTRPAILLLSRFKVLARVVMNRRQALEILRLAPGASHEEMREARRSMLLETHPDKGGSAAAFCAVKDALDQVLPDPKPKRGAGRPRKRRRGPAPRSDEAIKARRRHQFKVAKRRQRTGVAAQQAYEARERAAGPPLAPTSSLAVLGAPLPPLRALSSRKVIPALSPGTWDTRGAQAPPGANGTPERLRPRARRKAVTSWETGLTVAAWSAIVGRRIQAGKPIPSAHYFGDPTCYQKPVDHTSGLRNGSIPPTRINDRRIGSFELSMVDRDYYTHCWYNRWDGDSMLDEERGYKSAGISRIAPPGWFIDCGDEDEDESYTSVGEEDSEEEERRRRREREDREEMTDEEKANAVFTSTCRKQAIHSYLLRQYAASNYQSASLAARPPVYRFYETDDQLPFSYWSEK